MKAMTGKAVAFEKRTHATALLLYCRPSAFRHPEHGEFRHPERLRFPQREPCSTRNVNRTVGTTGTVRFMKRECLLRGMGCNSITALSNRSNCTWDGVVNR